MKDFWMWLFIFIIVIAVYAPYHALLRLHSIANELKKIRELLEKKEGE